MPAHVPLVERKVINGTLFSVDYAFDYCHLFSFGILIEHLLSFNNVRLLTARAFSRAKIENKAILS